LANQQTPPSDPFSAWREWITQSERQLNQYFNEVMGTDQYSRFLGQMTNLQLEMQKSMSEGMARLVTSLNLPTREDLSAMGTRLASIEERLGAIEAKLGISLEPAVSGDSSALSKGPKPPRTKKPPKAEGRAP